MRIDRRPVAERELSLIERAEALWGFGDGLKPVSTSVPTKPVEDLPSASPVMEKQGCPSTRSVRTDVGEALTSPSVRPESVEGQPARAPVPPVEVEGRPSTSSGRTEARDRLAFLRTDPQSAAEPDIEPLDLTQPALPEWAAPTGIAAIDRVMLAQKGMLVPGAPIGALAEEFRLVKRQLLLTARQVAEGPLGQRARTILVGSGKPGDGKTYSAINLAISLAAERDVEILLVDADFAKPDVMKTLGLEDSVGFLDILGDPTLDPEGCIVRTDVPQLSLLPAGAGTTMDTELLASKRTEEVIDRLLAANPKRMIVFDTPPTLAASPASVLALIVGQVMLVVRADRTTEADVREAVSLLDGCDHISLVLNAVSYQPGGGRFGSYYGQEKSK